MADLVIPVGYFRGRGLFRTIQGMCLVSKWNLTPVPAVSGCHFRLTSGVKDLSMLTGRAFVKVEIALLDRLFSRMVGFLAKLFIVLTAAASSGFGSRLSREYDTVKILPRNTAICFACSFFAHR